MPKFGNYPTYYPDAPPCKCFCPYLPYPWSQIVGNVPPTRQGRTRTQVVDCPANALITLHAWRDVVLLPPQGVAPGGA